ncbi:MAG: methyltransferase domain-containing protein [Betaproteobacteria bacterium]|nr:methyltransferase domain-containing protein [Betaproteobacteria bacterium]
MAEPSFPRADADAPEFWDMRWRAGFTPWDAGRVPRHLRELVASRRPAGRVLVPGCGSGHDVRFLAECGLDVEGIDFSEAAIEAARPVLGPHAARLRHGDFFADADGPFALVYERAFLCALPRRRWPDWAARMAAVVAPGGELAGYFLFGAGDRGPPFPLRDAAELDALLAGPFERVEDLAVDDSIAVFAGKERWQAWRRRA